MMPYHDLEKLSCVIRAILIYRINSLMMPITYTKLGLPFSLEANDSVLHDALRIITKKDGPKKPMLTSVVVHKGSGGFSTGEWFFKAAKLYGREFDDKITFLKKEQKEVYRYYCKDFEMKSKKYMK